MDEISVDFSFPSRKSSVSKLHTLKLESAMC
jgi:hypothetical protein